MPQSESFAFRIEAFHVIMQIKGERADGTNDLLTVITQSGYCKVIPSAVLLKKARYIKLPCRTNVALE